MLDVEFQDIIEHYRITGSGVVFRRAPEIFPMNEALVIHGGERRELSEMRWGFPNPYGKNRIINARSETVAAKPLFRDAFRRRRCLIPANGFFEWQKREGRNVKYRIGLPDYSLFSLAGLYGNFPAADGSLFPAFTIITTTATAALSPIHDRMPLIIPPADEALWLGGSPSDSNAATALLRPFTGELIVRPES
jgi:putative SOS response-associated peptidase YedK